jgi:hypothetical protein
VFVGGRSLELLAGAILRGPFESGPLGPWMGPLSPPLQ